MTLLQQLEQAQEMLRNYEELAVDQADNDAFIARGNGFCEHKYSDDFINMQLSKLKARITEIQRQIIIQDHGV